jgi:hypothetical protein
MKENPLEDSAREFWKPKPLKKTVVSKKGINWSSVEPHSPVTRVGGLPSINEERLLSKHWPHFDGKPLPFFAQVAIDESTIAYVFLDDTADASWQAEEGPNAVLIAGSWVAGDWIELKPLESHLKGMPQYSKQAFAADSSLKEPIWLQGDETPEGYTFLFQIPSQVDGGDLINIGDAYGDAYVFISEDKKTGKVLWQS